jgi:hypothetical protein
VLKLELQDCETSSKMMGVPRKFRILKSLTSACQNKEDMVTKWNWELCLTVTPAVGQSCLFSWVTG